jgi:hypothetical protein
MLYRLGLALAVVALLVAGSMAQTVPPPDSITRPDGWRTSGVQAAQGTSAVVPASAESPIPSTFRSPPNAVVPASATAAVAGSAPAGKPATAATAQSAAAPASASAATRSAGPSAPPASAPTPQRGAMRVTEGPASLPSNQGQVWREYDISPYTMRVTATNRPEQAIVDWILRETGYEAWHSEPVALLSANKKTLRVYHVPQMQEVVGQIVERFVHSEAETRAFSLRLVTVDQPNWRARVQQALRPVACQTPGVQAWLLEREDAAILVAELRRRSDFREHSSPHLLVNNGQASVISTRRPRPYVRDIVARNDVWPGFQAQQGQVEEGFLMEFSPLMSLDGRVIDAMIKCNIDQVEKMVPVELDLPTPAATTQRSAIEVPQVSHCRFQERIRWPIGQVLLVDLGMVALPFPAEAKSLIPGLPLALGPAPTRADLMIFIECRGEATEAVRSNAPSDREARKSHGRY